MFLLDTGAQFSSICKEAVEKYVDECRSPPMARLVCLMAKLWVVGLKDTIILPNLLYLVEEN